MSLLLAFGTYLAGIGLVALLSYRRSESATDFVLGGRSLNFYVTALSAHASDMSTWLFMAYPAVIVTKGVSEAWLAVGLVAGMLANWHFIAPRLRKETEATGSLTLSDYFSHRFNDRKGVIRLIGASASLLFFTAYVAAGLVGIGYLAESVLGIHKLVAMTVGLSFVVGYTLIGGYASVAWVDFCQALFLMAMIVLVPVVAWYKLGGLASITKAAVALNIAPSIVPEGGIVMALVLSLGWGFGYFGQTHILSKFMGIRDVSALRKSKWVGISWQLVCLAAATAVGFVGIAFFQGSLDNAELVFVALVQALFHPFIAGLILCAIVAAAISTMDSQLLVLVPVLSQDLYHRFLHKEPSARATLWSSRIALIVIGVVAYLIALFGAQTVMGLVFYSWSGLGSTFGPVLICALYSKRTTWAGAVTGMVLGGAIAALWPLVPTPLPAMIPGFLGSLTAICSVSILTRPALRRPMHPPEPLP